MFALSEFELSIVTFSSDHVTLFRKLRIRSEVVFYFYLYSLPYTS